jgi:G3E family GTPase
MAPVPVTIVTGFLGSGKTTLLLNLLPQLPPTYKLALLKNEFGDVAIDSQLASSSSISGVQELLNGCICCNLVGQLGDALETLKRDVIGLDRIIIETSGSAFPATLAMEVNRLAESTGGGYVLDGVITVIDVENWKGYEDTSYTAKMQAKYTDLVVFNKWELCDERRFDECLDRLGDLELEIAHVKSDEGKVAMDVVLGVDGGLAQGLGSQAEEHHHGEDGYSHEKGHQSEVEVLSVSLIGSETKKSYVDMPRLEKFLSKAPKDEIYRIKAVLYLSNPPPSSSTDSEIVEASPIEKYILNWAFGRWTFTPLSQVAESSIESRKSQALSMTVVLARSLSRKWESVLLKRDADNALVIDLEESLEEGIAVKRLL